MTANKAFKSHDKEERPRQIMRQQIKQLSMYTSSCTTTNTLLPIPSLFLKVALKVDCTQLLTSCQILSHRKNIEGQALVSFFNLMSLLREPA